MAVNIESKMKIYFVILIFIVFGLSNIHSQLEVDTLIEYKELDEFIVRQNFQKRYDRELERVIKIYPMALKAKAIMDEYEAELKTIDNRREEKKYSKKMNNFLKEEFTYSIRDLYISEGRLLMQLIHRETGRTVDEIITDYSGSGQAFIYRNMAKMFDQDLKVKYDSKDVNYYTEMVISDILMGNVEFDPEFDKMTKESFQESQKKYKEEKKEAKKNRKIYKKEQKENEKLKKKFEKQSKN